MSENRNTEKELKKLLPKTQAERVIQKFGGARKLARALEIVAPAEKRAPSSIYRWTYEKEKGGTGGVIPSHIWPDLEKAARLSGFLLSPDDYKPGKL